MVDVPRIVRTPTTTRITKTWSFRTVVIHPSPRAGPTLKATAARVVGKGYVRAMVAFLTNDLRVEPSPAGHQRGGRSCWPDTHGGLS